MTAVAENAGKLERNATYGKRDTPAAPTEWVDPFATIGHPSLSFRDKPIGFGYTVQIVSLPEMIRTVDDDGRPASWPNDPDTGKPGGPKMAAVTHVRILNRGIVGKDIEDVAGIEDELSENWIRSVWAVKPSAMFTAIQQARKDAGGINTAVGGVWVIVYSDNGPAPASKTRTAQKLYTVTYTPPKSDAPPF